MILANTIHQFLMHASDQVRKIVELIGIKELALAGQPFISNYYKENDSMRLWSTRTILPTT